jgi:hypothetical protein
MSNNFPGTFNQNPLALPVIRFAGVPLDAYGNVDVNAMGRGLASPVKLPLPVDERGKIDLPSAAEQFGDSAFPEQAKKRKEESEEEKGSESETGTETGAETETNEGGTKGPYEGPLADQEPDETVSEAIILAREILDRYPAIRREEREAEMQRYVLQGALRQRGLRELSRRQIESENIKAWKDLQVAREQARAAQAISLANTAYLAQIPNTGVMEAMNNAMKSAMQQVTIQAPTPNQGRNYFS